MTDESSGEAIRRSWSRLRRNHQKNVDNEGAREWEGIVERNHLGEGVAVAMEKFARWARDEPA